MFPFGLFQTRPPLPPIPPPPVRQLESVYSEIEYRPYLDILPEDDDDIMVRKHFNLSGFLCIPEKGVLSYPFIYSLFLTPDTGEVNTSLPKWLPLFS